MNQAQRFLTLLAGDEPVTFQTFDDGATKKPKLARILHGNLEEHAATLSALNAQGAGVFVMVNRGDGLGRKAANVTGIRALFVDLDGAPLEPVLAAGVEPHITIESSADRYHAYWLVSGCALEQFTQLQAALAAKFNSDPKVKDLPRVMRLPGFWHKKAEPSQTRIIEEKSHAPYAVADLIERLELNAKPTAQSAGDTTAQTLNFDRKNAIAGFAQGNRDDGLFRYACSLRGRGVEKEEARLLVLTAAANCQPPMPEPDATNCLESAWHYDSARTERLTDVGNAMRLVSLHGSDLRYVPEFKKWLVWDGGRWLIDEVGEIMRRAKDTAAAIYVEAKNASQAGEQPMADKLASHAGRSQAVLKLKAMIELAQSEPDIPARTTELDNNNYLLGVANGVINL